MYVEHFYALTAGSGNLITFLLQAQKNFIFSPFGMPETGSIGGAKRIKPVLFLMVFFLMVNIANGATYYSRVTGVFNT
ncbi:MAG: hypothetical protein AAB212_02535, partial [Bacteroidota bacterium]